MAIIKNIKQLIFRLFVAIFFMLFIVLPLIASYHIRFLFHKRQSDWLCNFYLQFSLKNWFEVVGTISTAVIAFLVYRAQLQRDNYDKKSQRPLLDFVNTDDGWILQNIGNGPACKVRFASANGEKSEIFEDPVIAYTIPIQTGILISKEIKYTGKLAAVYSGLDEKDYMILCYQSTTSEINPKDNKEIYARLYKQLHNEPRNIHSLKYKKLIS